MKAFKSKYNSGRCGFCKRRIVEGQLIVKLEKTVTWIESKRLIPHGGGRFFTDLKTADYAHAECMEDEDGTE